MNVRVLSADDAQAFSNLRREVVAVDPVGLGLSQDEELTRTLAGFQAQLAQPAPGAVFGAFIMANWSPPRPSVASTPLPRRSTRW